VGVLSAYGLALPLPTGAYEHSAMTDWWLAIFAFQAPVALAQLVLFKTSFQLDTPAACLEKAQPSQALASLCQVYPKDYADSLLLNVSKDEAKFESQIHQERVFTYTELLCCKKNTKKIMRMGAMACVIQQLCGIIPILSYATTLFSAFGGGVFILGVVKTFSVLAVLPNIDRWGRRPIYIVGPLLMAFFLCLIGLLAAFAHVIYVVPFLCIQGFLIAYEGSVGPVCWIYCGEIVPAKGMGLVIAVNWLCTIAASFSFPFMVEILGLSITFWVFAAINIAGAAYAWYDFEETKGMDKAEIQSKLLRIEGN
jgi:MFS transporter, SP family, major inositol transporter